MKIGWIMWCIFLVGFTGIQASADSDGTLFVVGGGKMPAAVRAEFFKIAGGVERARIVVIPSASNGADDEKETEIFLKDWRTLKPLTVQILHTRDRITANNPEFVKPLKEATAVWMSGGDQNKLIATYRGTLVEEEMHRLLKRGGIVGGTSAGAAVITDKMIEGGMPEARIGPGFGFLKKFIVDQHFVVRNRIVRHRGALDRYSGYGGIGVNEATAAIITGDKLRAIGESTVTVLWPRGAGLPVQERTLKSGESMDIGAIVPRATTPKP